MMTIKKIFNLRSCILLTMILVTCALKFEAKPIIQNLKLNHMRDIEEYKVYNHEHIYLIITGVGKIKSATATAFFIGRVGKPDFAINFGICGTSITTLDIGTALIANKIYEESSDRSFYPKITTPHNFKEMTLHTFDKPVKYKLLDSVAVDMEGSGFFQSANKFLDEDRIFLVKVISDHLDVERLDPLFIEEILRNRLADFKNFLEKLETKAHLKGLSTIDRLNLKKDIH